ncbi:L-proline glycine betaine ABC transport system permease protein ProV [Gracilibacillus boraciitolerans JCM 21714]|uniref:L-proline glycine betaine ABC transport system permease protein ProV n=1 Tax=Gracilibacillus boraciitolerans JCM 21714 TaxID=1298598 RepID=W4VNJ6_9BACI|nr:L-proline glycine betaine ABC transport system permease protein ProV [Gracilibacillus boraciitolerans JCM 21714]
MDIATNVAVVPRLLKWDKQRIDKRVDELLNMVGLEPETYRNRYPSELSGGQQQRIGGVIRALAAEPSLILMDEPFSALDPISREQLQEELIRLQKEIKKSIVFVTHDMDEALKIADKIVLMKDGNIVQQASPEEILRHPANDFVKNFIGKKRLQQVAKVPSVKEIMVRKPITISPKRGGLAEAMKIMESKEVDTLLIVNDEDELQGYISIFDVLNEFEDESKRVKDIIQKFEHVVNPNMLLTEAINLINENNASYIPVVNDQNKLRGLLTRGSIVGHLSDVYPFNNNRGGREDGLLNNLYRTFR